MTHAETTFEPSYPHNVKISQLADRLGMEMLIPVGRWKHFGGSTRFNENNLEVYTWATAMACNTENIMVFATSHVPTVHPLFAAKQGASIDNISGGRFGLNIVCGWFRPEIEMFGMELREHDDRYRVADDWLTVIKRTWTEQDFDHDGEFYRIRGGFLLPKPVQQPHPVLINAGSSEAGREFSAKNVDFNFISINSQEEAASLIRDVKKRAGGYGREIGAMSMGLVMCRDTEAEAQELYRNILDHGDWEGADNIMSLLGVESDSFGDAESIKKLATRFVAGWGGYHLIGTPEQVVDQMVGLHKLGLDGLVLAWLDYHEEMKYFGERVMPLLRQAGLRK
ncbi:MAG: LLM class flavin-dependent oxidoreductase [Myxococcales bacterium]|nr:LLM class flavin-dependent oxidoreductase [Myxococcales bacterium]